MSKGYLPDLGNLDGPITIEVTQLLPGWWYHSYSIAGWGEVVALSGRYTTYPGTWGGTMSPRREKDYLHGYKLGGSMYPLHGGRSPTSMVTDKEEVDILAKEVDCLPTWLLTGRMFASPPQQEAT